MPPNRGHSVTKWLGSFKYSLQSPRGPQLARDPSAVSDSAVRGEASDAPPCKRRMGQGRKNQRCTKLGMLTQLQWLWATVKWVEGKDGLAWGPNSTTSCRMQDEALEGL